MDVERAESSIWLGVGRDLCRVDMKAFRNTESTDGPSVQLQKDSCQRNKLVNNLGDRNRPSTVAIHLHAAVCKDTLL